MARVRLVIEDLDRDELRQGLEAPAHTLTFSIHSSARSQDSHKLLMHGFG